MLPRSSNSGLLLCSYSQWVALLLRRSPANQPTLPPPPQNTQLRWRRVAVAPRRCPCSPRPLAHLTDKELQKRVGLDGVRCATTLQQQEPLQDFLRLLSRQFPHDPEVLYVLTHAYSDLSARAAQELAITAPTSIPALEMDADASEQQGKWDQAEKDYQKILQQNPRYPGIHFRLARLLLSKPNPAPDFAEQAKKELQQELEIDPSNAGAEYVLGELARQAQDLPAAVKHFAKATQLDPNFADAYLGLGMIALGGEEISGGSCSAGKGSQTSTRKSWRTLQPGHRLCAHWTKRRCGAGICFAAADLRSAAGGQGAQTPQ